MPWKEWQEKAPSLEQVSEWHARNPDALWAVVAGQVSGVIVLDFDGEDGAATIDRLDLAPTVRTPSGGYHLYVRAPSWPVKGGARVDPHRFPGMDLRADGQLATFYGERDGQRYEKVDGARLYEPEELPGDVRRLLHERKREPQPDLLPLPDDFDKFLPDDDLLREAVERCTEEGSREAGGFHLACQLRDERLDEREGEEAVMDLGRRYVDFVAALGNHPYTLQEFYNSWVSAMSWPRREPRALGKGLAYRPMTDLGNAERLAALHGQDLRYCHQWGSWLVWDGRRWRRDATAEAERRVKNTVRETFKAAHDLDSVEARNKLLKFARQSEAVSRQRAMLQLAESDADVAIEPDDLDADPWLLNLLNGTLDLRTGELRGHSRSDLITKLAPVVYDPRAEAPRWHQFLSTVMPDEEDRAFLQRAVGYSMTGSVREHCLFILFGTGRNGKGTFTGTVQRLLADYAQEAPSDLFMAKRPGSIPAEVARLKGARFVSANETDDSGRLDESAIKRLTGGDRVVARFLHANYFEFDPTHKLWLATNHLPVVRGTDEAIWERLKAVSFSQYIAREDRDSGLKDKLWEEASGILAWAVEGCLKWQQGGLGESANVRAATEEYREESDVFGQFIEDRCLVGEGHEVTSDALYIAYSNWVVGQGLSEMSKVAFGRKLGERREGFEKAKLKSGTKRGWRGIALRPTPVQVKDKLPVRQRPRKVPDEEGSA